MSDVISVQRLSHDERWLRHALTLAARARGRTAPNPMVGAVVVRGGRVVGEGFHHAAGLAHAEPIALRRAGARTRGATLYVTLEPCHHTGRTGPCTDAIVQAGIARVVVGAGDNDARVRGRGLRYLRAHGIDVRAGVLRSACQRLNAPYHFAKAHHRAWVAGVWPCDAAAAIRHMLRRRLRDAFDVVAVSAAALMAAHPTLGEPRSVRRNPARLVIDPRAQLPPRVALLRAHACAPTFVACRASAPRARQQRLAAAGAIILPMGDGPSAASLREVLEGVCAQGRHSVLVDSDPALLRALLRARLVQRLWGVQRAAQASAAPASLWVQPDWQQRVGEALVWAGRPRAR